MSKSSIHYREFTPGNAVAHLVSRFWIMSAGDAIVPATGHRVLPDGCVDLITVAKRHVTPFMTVRGPRLTPLVIDLHAGDRFFGARLWPDAGALVTRMSAGDLVDRMYPAQQFFGEEGTHVASLLAHATNDSAVPALWEEWLAPMCSQLPPLDPAVRLALVVVNASDGALKTSEIARAVALSPRQLQRRFRSATGLTVKSYARIRRMRQSLEHLLDGRHETWTTVAARLGFTDQSHLVGEFNRLAGLHPSAVAQYVRAFSTRDVIP